MNCLSMRNISDTYVLVRRPVYISGKAVQIRYITGEMRLRVKEIKNDGHLYLALKCWLMDQKVICVQYSSTEIREKNDWTVSCSFLCHHTRILQIQPLKPLQPRVKYYLLIEKQRTEIISKVPVLCNLKGHYCSLSAVKTYFQSMCFCFNTIWISTSEEEAHLYKLHRTQSIKVFKKIRILKSHPTVSHQLLIHYTPAAFKVWHTDISNQFFLQQSFPI